MNTRTHWQQIYTEKEPTQVSWYQPEPTVSLRLIREVVRDADARIIDVGGGASTLVDHLLDAGFASLTVLDISGQALNLAREHLGGRAEPVTWLEADVLSDVLPEDAFDFWHDRAVFHFLIDESDRRRYVEQVHHSVCVGGHVTVGTFAPDGPTHCSGLEVVRYGADELHAEFGSDFRLLETEREEHVTPSGAVQPFTYCMCRVSG